MTLFELLPNLFALVNTFILSSGIIHQIVVQNKISSAKGVSFSTTAVSMFLSFFNFYFTIARSLPPIYLYMHSSAFLLRAILLGQCVVYSKRNRLEALFNTILVILFFSTTASLLFYFSAYTIQLGDFVGWCLAFSAFPMIVPQLLHNWRRSSVEGFSKVYLFTGEFAVVLNAAATIMFHLPVQSLIQAAVGLLLRSIEILQHMYYWKARVINTLG